MSDKTIFYNSKSIRQAEPTSALVPEPYTDCQLWAEIVEYEGVIYEICYIFDYDDMHWGCGTPREAEDYPFDFEHVEDIEEYVEYSYTA